MASFAGEGGARGGPFRTELSTVSVSCLEQVAFKVLSWQANDRNPKNGASKPPRNLALISPVKGNTIRQKGKIVCEKGPGMAAGDGVRGGGAPVCDGISRCCREV